jgi:hypothetical protein
MSEFYPFYQVKRVFLACPGDLVAERSRFPRLLETVNNLRAHSLGIHLEPVGWERVIPSFGRPQELINEELNRADLAIILFWNRIGSPAGVNTQQTGTLEEFDLATKLFNEFERPVVWIYFRKPTEKKGVQVDGVFRFRKELEAGRQLFFREYESLDQWEQMLQEHLVAFLDGTQRWNLDQDYQQMRPDLALLKGRFLGEGIYWHGPKLKLSADLDGDGNDEVVSYWFSQFSYSLSVNKYDSCFYLELPEADHTQALKISHLAIKDINNDGLPEIILAKWDGMIDLKLFIWGFNKEGRETRMLTQDNFGLIAQLKGQRVAYVLEGGTIKMPYGSQGLVGKYRWIGDCFQYSD